MAATPRTLALSVLVVLALPAVLAPPGTLAEGTVCPGGLQSAPGVGTYCPREDGLLALYAPDMTPLGLSHGPDPAPAGSATGGGGFGALGGTTPQCMSGAPGTFYVQVIYARAFDDADQYAALVNPIRTMVGDANKYIDDSAIATGSTSSIKTKCTGGIVDVAHAVLPTAMASADFTTIVSDLQAAGYANSRVKYWVFYDDTGACTCGGMAHIYPDNSSATGNDNNGNRIPMFAVDFGYVDAQLWVHELAHTLGAIQLAAPHSSLAWHCYDGFDVMCYNDGGPNGSLYATTYCATVVFDCNNDDYLHASPPAGSYLANHWNLGRRYVRFLETGVNAAPVVTSLACGSGPTPMGVPRSCGILSADDSPSVTYTVDWGDSSSDNVPLGAFVHPQDAQIADHLYAAPGTYTITVTATDDVGLTGPPTTRSVTIVTDARPPELSVQDPAFGFLYSGCGLKQSIPAGRIVWLDTACVRATATDADSGVDRIDVYVDNVLRATDTTAPYELEFPVPGTSAGAVVRIEAVDVAGNKASLARTITTLRV